MLIHEIPLDERTIQDEQVFQALDLTRTGLEKVRYAFEQKQLDEAKKELIHYMETRTAPCFLYDYRTLPLSPIDTDSCPYAFQSSLGLRGNLKDFCLYVAKKLIQDHVYVPPGADGRDVELGKNWETMIHYNFYEDSVKKHRNQFNMIVRGQFFESLCVLYHETGDSKVLQAFEEILQVFLDSYPLVITHAEPSANRFQYTEDRDVMSVGWLAVVYISLFYTRIPYEISYQLSFEILKRIWFLGIQFSRFEHDSYRPYNHHMWERGLVPYMLGLLLPEIPDFAAMKIWSAPIVCRHIKEDFNSDGGYNEHSIAYWSGAAVGEMLYRGISLARLNHDTLLDEEALQRMEQTFHILAMICPPNRRYPSLGDNGGPLADPILNLGIQTINHWECEAVSAIRNQKPCNIIPPLDYFNDKTGFVCSKSGYDEKSNYILMSAKIDCGYSGHNHMDMLSIFLTMRGQEIIGEPYTDYLYHKVRMNSEIRGYMYNMESHNSVLAYGAPIVPNRMYANKWGVMRPSSPVLEARSFEQGLYVKAFHDGYTFCRHQRTWLFHRTHGLLLSDQIQRGNRMESPHIQRFHLMPQVKAIPFSNDSILVEADHVRLLFLWSGAQHKIILNKPSLLVPEMKASEDDLCQRIDVEFEASPEQKADNVAVSVHLLILDITDLDRNITETDCQVLSDQVTRLLPNLAQPDALIDFPHL